MAKGIPSGTVTFLFTDIEGSTALAQQYPGQWELMRARHHELMHPAMRAHDGLVFEIVGDAFCVAFHTARQALGAAVEAQRVLHAEPWEPASVRVRMGIHTGTAEPDGGGGYHGYTALARTQRLMSSGHGGQVLVSLSTEQLVREDPPPGVSLRDVGEKRLKDLVFPERIFQLVISGLPEEFPPLKTLDAYRHNLPPQMTSFIGREEEISEVTQAVRTHRLVTLTGPGGAGKTRLALQVAADLLDDFPDGAWFVELASLEDPKFLPQAVLAAFGVSERPGRTATQSLLDFLRSKHLLLVLDNCEHLIASSAELTGALLTGVEIIRIMTTSREPLGVGGEAAWPVPALSFPDIQHVPGIDLLSQYEAVRLFTERARLVQPHFTVTESNAAAVAQICSRLDGIPLAIELAAARVKTLGTEQIAARLDDRFKILTANSRTALPRHQTLRAALDWSHALLSEAEQLLLHRLSVFAGGWTLEAAEDVCNLEGDQLDILDLLARLVDKSWVQVSDASGSTRYRMLETTRQYAREHWNAAGEPDAIRKQHAEYFAALAEGAASEWERAGFGAFLPVSGEQDNILTALEWALSGQAVQIGARLAAEMANIWDGHSLTTLQAHWARRARSYVRDLPPEVKARVLGAAARAESVQNNMEVAKQLGLQALAMFRDLGNAYRVGRTLVDLVSSTVDAPTEYAQAKAWQAEAVAIARAGGHLWLESTALIVLGEVARAAGDYATARTAYEDALQHAVRTGDPMMESISCYDLSIVRAHGQEYGLALDAGRRALRLTSEHRFDVHSAYFLTGVAGAIGGLGKPEIAARLYGASEALLESLGSVLQPSDVPDCERGRAGARALTGSERFEALIREGRSMTLGQATALALSGA